MGAKVDKLKNGNSRYSVSTIAVIWSLVLFAGVANAGGTVPCDGEAPCINKIYESGNNVVFEFNFIRDWEYYNVRYKGPDGNDKQVENRSGVFTFKNTLPNHRYTLSVQGCNTRTFASSTCSPWASDSIVTKGPPAPVAAPVPANRDRVELVNKFSNLRADVMWASTDDLQGVFLWPDNTSYSQEFELLDSGNGYFRIKARHSGKCLMLDWRPGNYGNSTSIIQYPACGANYAPAEWQLRPLSGTRCSEGICTTGVDRTLLVNRETGQCLDADNRHGGRPPSEARLQLWDCVTSTDAWNIGNQAWALIPPGVRSID
jgi:hypothetical protein